MFWETIDPGVGVKVGFDCGVDEILVEDFLEGVQGIDPAVAPDDSLAQVEVTGRAAEEFGEFEAKELEMVEMFGSSVIDVKEGVELSEEFTNDVVKLSKAMEDGEGSVLVWTETDFLTVLCWNFSFFILFISLSSLDFSPL